MLKVDVDVSKELTEASKALAPALKRLKARLAKLDPAKQQPGALADLLYGLEQLAKQLGTLAAPFTDVVQPKIKEVEDHFINTLAVGEATGVQGHSARVQINDQVVPTVENWEAFYAHIKKTGSFELLNRAVNRKAVTERWDAKKQVPGVGRFVAKKVSCTKLSGKKAVHDAA